MYLIPKELNSKLKISRHIYIKQFFIGILGLGLVLMFDNLVVPSLKIIYYIFSFFAVFFLLLPAKHNPEKYNYEAIYYALFRKKNVFHALSIVETMDNAEIERLQPTKDEKIYNNDCKKHETIENKDLLNNENLACGAIITYKGKMFYVKSIEELNIEAYQIVDGLKLMKTKNAISIKVLEKEKTLSLDKAYCLNIKKIGEISGQLDEETISQINNNIDFLKKAGALRYNSKSITHRL